MKPIILTESQWNGLFLKIQERERRSTWMIRTAMRDKLGFTVRHHRRFDDAILKVKEEIHLDFFDDAKRTMFLLKYGNDY